MRFVVLIAVLVSILFSVGWLLARVEAHRRARLNKSIGLWLGTIGSWSSPHSDSITILLDDGGDIHTRSEYGDTVLEYAVYNCLPELVHRAIASGVPVNEGRGLPLNMVGALCDEHPEVLQMLLEAGAREGLESALVRCSGEGHTNMVRELLNAGADPNDSRKEYSALQGALERNRLDIVQILLSHGAMPRSREEWDAIEELAVVHSGSSFGRVLAETLDARATR